MLVNRKCLECKCKFTYEFVGKRIRKFCDDCSYQRKLNSNKRYKELHSESNKIYHKNYSRRLRERDIEK